MSHPSTDPRIESIRACPDRVTSEPDWGRPGRVVPGRAKCRLGRGVVPGLVTLRDCLDCASIIGPEGPRYPFRKDVLFRTALTSWTGYGQIGEWLGRGLESLGLGVGFADIGTDPRYLPPNPWVAARAVPARAEASWSILLAPPCEANPAGRVVRFTMWESSRISPSAAAALNAAELVCVPCEANRTWFVDSGVRTPIAVVPMGISPSEGYRDEGTSPPSDLCRFGMAARMAHGGGRKGLNEGMEAFVAAFPTSIDDVELVLKVWPDCVGQLRVPDDRRIRVVTTPMKPFEMAAWYRTLTALLVPSKGEGWGLHTHQAMAVGCPVIVAPWGGTADFWDDRCGWPLEFDLAPAGDFYAGQGEWAVPRTESMVERLRQVYAGREDAASRGRMAARRAAEFTWDRTAHCLHRALYDAGFIRMEGDTRRPRGGRGAAGAGGDILGSREHLPLSEGDALADSSEDEERRNPRGDAAEREGMPRDCRGETRDLGRSRSPAFAGPGGLPASLDIPIVIMTAARSEPYLERTLASLAPRRPITIMVGTPEADYIGGHRGNPLLRIDVPGPADYARVAGSGVHKHAAWNYWRCLVAGEDRQRLLIFEDDVRFSFGWEGRLARIIARIEREHADYVLSLYYPYPGEDDEGAGFVAYPKEQFFGTQGVLFAGGALRGFRTYLYERGVDNWMMPYDWLLRDYTIDRGVPLFAAMPALVQHIGAVTTGQSDWFHTAPRFAEDVEDL